MVERGVAVVVEDDDDVRTVLTEVLLQSGFAVQAASTGNDGVEAVRNRYPDIVLMDVGLPDFDGFEALRRIRAFSDAYLIIITGRVDEADALMGFAAGADDFLPKPFRPRELRARIGAMLRRPRVLSYTEAEAEGAASKHHQSDEQTETGPSLPATNEAAGTNEPLRNRYDFAHKGLTLHEDSRQATIDSVPVELTRTQFDLLLVLMENGRRVQTKADLVRRLRNEPYNTGSFVSTGEERAVEVHLANLRRRLGDRSRRPRWIETVRGVGYRLTQ
ncbi:response regulator transcription factor [Arthrobacter sp. B1I2]|uniref:response regulator transcription factor n=1 Tax=Arthrobacter sp. B1I2 TaxID=3042263 RepID=UPI002780A08A|nr:response regulator transcription factor [Arthrobacter sp. B1I2]MDQ0730695.1 two-component system OmpR family response regulator [Arthrobacter sp. B1I2]